MHPSQSRLMVASAIALALTLGVPDSSIAQRTKGDEGTGGAAGYSPPLDAPNAAAPAAPAAPSTTAPAQSDDTGEPPPASDTPPSDDKPDEATPPDAPTGADQPD